MTLRRDPERIKAWLRRSQEILRAKNGLRRKTPLSPVSKNPDRRRRLRAKRDREYGRDRESGTDFAQFIRDHPCAVRTHGVMPEPGFPCYGPIHAAHVRDAGRGAHPNQSGTGKLVPLCRQHDGECESIGFAEFEGKYSVDTQSLGVEFGQRWEPNP